MIECGVTSHRCMGGGKGGVGEHVAANRIPEVMVFRKTEKNSVLAPSWCDVNNGSRQTTAILILNI